MLPSPLALTANDGAAAALLAAVATLVVVAAVRLARRVRPLPPPATPAEIERDLEAAAPPSPAPLPAAAPPAPSAPAGAAPGEPAEGDAEAAKRAAYRARKEEERLERERRRAERAAAEERARDEAARAAAEAEAARLAAAEEARRRAEAEAGKTLAAGLARTRGGFMARLDALLGGGGALDAAGLAELEEILFTADIGVRTSTRLLETVRERVRARTLADPAALRAALRAEIGRILAPGAAGPGPEALATPGAARPWVVMVVGVNGSGKTTTIGKLGARLRAAGHSVLLGAGDTFRAAAGEQLEIWAERIGAPIVRGKDGSDPASVCFEAARRGAETGADVVLCDTAGRLHTKAPLMEELKKVQRVIGKAVPGAPHEVLLVLDATSGQNAIAQARQFHEALGVTGIVLTKLDGTAKGGVVIGITDELRIPVRWVGIGEAVPDLRPFSPSEFVEALFA